MPYLVDTLHHPDSAAAREALRPAHLAYLAAHMGLLLAAGAKLEDGGAVGAGSFYILAVEDRAMAEAFIAAEPYARGGLCATVTYTRWRKAIFNFARETPAQPSSLRETTA
ncbi:YciI family protein [Prosthecomicrobium pneumaticum]|uniref:YCII-related domain-containing protein n=1 Tax=Prosthecomicrobium pneumaticum TaxID=81895 RepID=A0A7W9L3S2_9HYPH|nr:YciI family protein [Prosthecomicrobium pneumaticum]MBB5754837.1 hypothetical protein [Prosthecomicrobium pneumaticum]